MTTRKSHSEVQGDGTRCEGCDAPPNESHGLGCPAFNAEAQIDALRHAWKAENVLMVAEVNRLRKALERIAEWEASKGEDDGPVQGIARAALSNVAAAHPAPDAIREGEARFVNVEKWQAEAADRLYNAAWKYRHAINPREFVAELDEAGKAYAPFRSSGSRWAAPMARTRPEEAGLTTPSQDAERGRGSAASDLVERLRELADEHREDSAFTAHLAYAHAAQLVERVVPPPDTARLREALEAEIQWLIERAARAGRAATEETPVLTATHGGRQAAFRVAAQRLQALIQPPEQEPSGFAALDPVELGAALDRICEAAGAGELEDRVQVMYAIARSALAGHKHSTAAPTRCEGREG